LLGLTSEFLKSVSGGIAQKWIDRLLSPAFVFWSAGLLAYVWRFGQHRLVRTLQHLTPFEIGVIIAGGIAIVAASSALVEAIEFYVLRLLEGYWPRLFNPAREWLVDRAVTRVQELDKKWEALAASYAEHTREERLDYVRLDRKRALYPEDRKAVMPTQLGNILRMAESYSSQRYGLAAVLIWPRLWLVLPDGVREDLGEARGRLDSTIRLVVWSGAFAIWTIWAWWALPIALLGVWGSYRHAIVDAFEFGELVMSTFDLHHRTLYTALEWPLPSKGVGPPPRETGIDLTLFLRRGKVPPIAAAQPKSDAGPDIPAAKEDGDSSEE
jgi:hypothetical protein